jgi:hypothetical protein
MEELLAQLKLQVSLIEKDLPTDDNYSELDTRLGEIERTLHAMRLEVDSEWQMLYRAAMQFRKPSHPRIERTIDDLL